MLLVACDCVVLFLLGGGEVVVCHCFYGKTMVSAKAHERPRTVSNVPFKHKILSENCFGDALKGNTHVRRHCSACRIPKRG